MGCEPALYGNRQIASLTALRGIAAFVVLLAHAADIGGVPAPNAVGISRGYLAVDVFFLLSGFLLALSYGNVFAVGSSFAIIRSFLWARFARTYPVHLLVLIFLLPLYGIDRSFSGVALIKNLLLIQAPWSLLTTWNYPAWSISAEWHAYVLFPLVVTSLLRGSVASVVRMMLYAVVALAIVAWTYDGLISVASGPAVLLRTLPEFLVGIILYRLYSNRCGASWLSRDISAVVIASMVVAMALVPHTDLLVIIGLLPIFLLSIAYNSGTVTRLLSFGPVQFLGHVSYSIYMVQMLPALLFAFYRPLLGRVGIGSPAREAIVYIVLSVLLGTTLSLLIEHPARKWLRRIFLERGARGFPIGQVN